MREGNEFHERYFLFDRVETEFERRERWKRMTHATFLNKKLITSIKHL
jgi:hypothetical protein